jgi:phytoene synthase
MTSRSVAVSDTPTRDHDEENFPTASLLLAPAQRARVMAFYRFVRTADDVADSPDLPPAAKLARLDAMERALDDPATAMPEARRLHELEVGTAEARLMLSAFKQDATQTRYADWAALEDYCRRSADPSGGCCCGCTATAERGGALRGGRALHRRCRC